MDASLFAAINGLAGHNPTIDHVVAIISENGPYFLIAFLAVLWFWPGVRAVRDRLQWGVIVAVISAGLALGANLLISHLWDRPRPFVTHTALVLVPHKSDASFPSDHVVFSFTIAFAIFIASRRAGILALLVAAAIAFARVYAGDHYVTDVLAGAAVGLLSATIVNLFRPIPSPLVGPPLRLARRVHLA
jgi:undecaprenyl-diphosphatase